MRLINFQPPIMLATLLLLIHLGCSTKKNYTLKGEIRGAAEGMKVILQKNELYPNPPVNVDSTIIENGQFVFEGTLDTPALYNIIIDATPKDEKSSERNWLRSRFYLENSDIHFSGHLDSLPTYFWSERVTSDPIIKGSKTQDLYEEYKSDVAALSKKASDLNSQYLEQYHVPALEGIFNTEKGIALQNELDRVRAEIDKVTFDFIKKNPESAVAYDKAMEYFTGMYIELTPTQVDELVTIIARGWKGTPQMKAFEVATENGKRTAVGAKYQDFELLTPEGEKVMLSDYIEAGEYVLLEFWASWCGPCRGEIPHLKHVYEQYKDKGFKIISISIDELDADWKKAMAEEDMDWIQLNDPNGFNGEISQAYNILGIPYAIFLDKDGKIFKFGMRGASLDAALVELYGKP